MLGVPAGIGGGRRRSTGSRKGRNLAVLQDRLLTRFPAAAVDRTDGVRLVWPGGWLLARRSVPAQAVTL